MDWIFFPKHNQIPDHLLKITDVFLNHSEEIDSSKNDSNELRLSSNKVLKILSKSFEKLGYQVEKGKKKNDKIRRPVLFGNNGNEELSFEADAYNKEYKTVIEVEAGRAVINYQFLKDIFQASMMIDTNYLVLAVRKSYVGNNDFETIKKFLEVMYSTNRIKLDLKGILIVGY